MTAVADLKAALGWHDQQSTLKTCQAIPAWVIAKIQIALAKTEALTTNIVRLRMRLDELTAERDLLKSIQKNEADATDFLLKFAGIDQESVTTEGGVINVGKLRDRLDELAAERRLKAAAAEVVAFRPVVAKHDRDWPNCSGNPNDCPENEGYGCCQIFKPKAGRCELGDALCICGGDVPAIREGCAYWKAVANG